MACFSGGPYGIFSIIDSGVLVTHGPSKLIAFRGGRTKENYERNMYLGMANLLCYCIPVHGRIKEAARVDNLDIPQHAGWITSYANIKYEDSQLKNSSETISGIV